jgi:hypothetical protein
VAFKIPPPQPTVPDSPEKLLLELPRRKIPGVLLHQGEILRSYVTQYLLPRDVAIQLPTGSGKTLVGLLIAEWRRRKFRERVVYLCPTRQLVNQVAEQAEDQYGLTVSAFTGPMANYEPAAKSQYRSADTVAITTYNSLFNVNPFFSDADVILLDDAHASENYIAAVWSLQIDRTNPDHAPLHAALANVLKPLIEPLNYTRLLGECEGIADRTWVDKIPGPMVCEIAEQIGSVIDAHVGETNLKWPWRFIQGHLEACQIYLSTEEILIRPLIPPTWTHAPFENAKQRIFMSATLGAGGDLERLTGRRNISRLPVPPGWDRQGIGRRYFVFPDMSLRQDETSALRHELMRRAGRSLVLVPSEAKRRAIAEDVQARLGFTTFDAAAIEESKQPFVQSRNAVAVVANRYDGIDFPGTDCRLLFIEGLPKGTNLQERFFMSRMGSNILLNERVQTRVLQAIGRCTRSLQDYSAVVVSGEELPDYLTDRRRRGYFHPELQAELEFGVEQSQGTSVAEICDNFGIFLENKKEWEAANQQILGKRDVAVRQPFPAMESLAAAAPHEIDYQSRIWQRDYVEALRCAESALASLTAPELRGYRAVWHYLAGTAASYAEKGGMERLGAKARTHFEHAKEAARGLPWLVGLTRRGEDATGRQPENRELSEQIERLETVLLRLGTVHPRNYSRQEAEILGGLISADRFEAAQRSLGELLGFGAGKVEREGSPDPWWTIGQVCIVFEDHVGAGEGAIVDVRKARQVASHPQWVRANVPLPAGADVLPVLVTPCKLLASGALVHLSSVAVWPLAEFREWAIRALGVVRQVRNTLVDVGDLAWRAEAAAAIEAAELDARGILRMLKERTPQRELTVTGASE